MNNNIIRMEKKATNKIGLIIIFIITIFGIIIGGYLLYENKNNLDFSLPWEKKEEEEIIDEEPPKENKNNTSGGRLYLPILNDDQDLMSSYKMGVTFYLKRLQATLKGYEFDVEVNTNDYNSSLELNCTKILIDGYEVTPTFYINVSYQPNTRKTAHVIIPFIELENLEIRNFRTLSFFMDIKQISDGKEEIFSTLLISSMIQDVYADNNKIELESFTQQENVRISYHKKIDAEDATYLYFIIDNTNLKYDFNIELKKLIVDNKIYNDIEVNAKTHHQSKNIFFIKLSKKKIKKPEKVTLSFIVSREDETGRYIYMTDEETLDLTK